LSNVCVRELQESWLFRLKFLPNPNWSFCPPIWTASCRIVRRRCWNNAWPWKARCGAELDGLRETVALVRDLPRLKAPRDFTLDPAVYARPYPGGSACPRSSSLAASGVLGAAASVVLIVAAVLLGSGDEASRSAEEQAAPAQPPEIAVQGTATEFARTLAAEPEETAIAFTGEDFQSTAAAQSHYFATHYSTPTLLPTPVFRFTPSPDWDTTYDDAATMPEAGPALESAAADQAEMPMPAAPGSEESPAVMEAGSYPPAEPSYAAGAGAAPAPPAASPQPTGAGFAPPSATITAGLLAVPQVASPAEGGFRERDSDEEETNEAVGQDGAVNLPTGQAFAAVTATPAEVAQAIPDTVGAMKDESRERSRWLGLGGGGPAGLVLFALSSVIFFRAAGGRVDEASGQLLPGLWPRDDRAAGIWQTPAGLSGMWSHSLQRSEGRGCRLY
jgi:hypothetical protein